MKRAAVSEVQELVLTTSFDALDTSAGERPQTRGRQAGAESRMHYSRADDRAAFRRNSQLPNGLLDFGKLRHALGESECEERASPPLHAE
jgi:hypothetical protein